VILFSEEFKCMMQNKFKIMDKMNNLQQVFRLNIANIRCDDKDSKIIVSLKSLAGWDQIK